MKCHCGGELIAHEDDGVKEGAYHCNGCGCCMTADGENRPGHDGCGRSGIVREPEPAEDTEQPEKPEHAPVQRTRAKA